MVLRLCLTILVLTGFIFNFPILLEAATPPNQSMLVEKSGPPAWKQLPAWFQVSENDRIIYPGAERNFTERMNATTLSLNSSHASLVSHPDEIAELILNATKGSIK